MGNTKSSKDNSVELYIKNNFKKLKINDEEKIPINKIILFSKYDEISLKLNHLFILYFLDKEKKGYINKNNIYKFFDFCIKNFVSIKNYEFQNMIQSKIILIISEDFNKIDNFCLWFKKILIFQKKFIEFPLYYKNELYWNLDHINLWYDIIEINLMNGINLQEFFNLLQHSGEELKLTSIKYEKMDDFVPYKVVDLFLKNFLQGFINTFNEINLTKY